MCESCDSDAHCVKQNRQAGDISESVFEREREGEKAIEKSPKLR